MRSSPLSTIRLLSTIALLRGTDQALEWTGQSSPMDNLPVQLKCKAIAWATDRPVISNLFRASYIWKRLLMKTKRETMVIKLIQPTASCKHSSLPRLQLAHQQSLIRICSSNFWATKITRFTKIQDPLLLTVNSTRKLFRTSTWLILAFTWTVSQLQMLIDKMLTWTVNMDKPSTHTWDGLKSRLLL